ncbi:MAG: hypothetical protein IPH82_26995 [Chloroflexi bacterium]|nr:hypothetical protein [Chloroflexota bacterium]
MTITAPQNVNKIPLAPGLPVLGSALPLAQNVAHFLTKQYRQLGPVFRVRALNREMVVLAGVEANLFYAQEGKTLFRSKDFWQEQDAEFGANRSLISMDGDDHTRFRKVQRPGYARSMLFDNLPTAVAITTREMSTGRKISRCLPCIQFNALSLNSSVLLPPTIPPKRTWTRSSRPYAPFLPPASQTAPRHIAPDARFSQGQVSVHANRA